MTNSSERDYAVAAEGEMEVSQIDTGAAYWKAFVNKGGTFRAHHPEYGNVTANSHDALAEAARKATATGRVRLNVPYDRLVQTHTGEWEIVHGTATGIHGGNGNLMVNEGRGAVQVTGWNQDRNHLRPMTIEHCEEMLRLARVKSDAERQLKELQQQYVFPGGLLSIVKAEVERVKREGAGHD